MILLPTTSISPGREESYLPHVPVGIDRYSIMQHCICKHQSPCKWPLRSVSPLPPLFVHLDGQHESTAASGTTSPSSSSSSQQLSQSQSSALTGTEDHASGIDVAMETSMDTTTGSVDTSLENSSTLDNSALLGSQNGKQY